MTQAPAFRASAGISPRRFVKITGNHTVAHAGAGEKTIGISQDGAAAAPIPGASGLAAESGNPCRIFGLGDVCPIDVGASAINAGDYLKADANGKAVPATANADWYGARAIVGAAASTTVLVVIERGQLVVPA